MAGLGWQELLIVLVIVMIVFGAGKLPQAARSLGQGVKEFKQEASNTRGTLDTAADDHERDPGERKAEAAFGESRGTRAEQV